MRRSQIQKPHGMGILDIYKPALMITVFVFVIMPWAILLTRRAKGG
jgi:hypothetical protein